MVAVYARLIRNTFLADIVAAPLTWNTPIASAATAACKGVRPFTSCALSFAPKSSNFLAASALENLLDDKLIIMIIRAREREGSVGEYIKNE